MTSDATGRPGRERTRGELVGWAAAALILAALAVPWFLWRDAAVVAGLPVWLWWHVGWMALASLAFYAFTRRAWGLGIVSDDVGRNGSEERPGADGAEEVSHRG